MLYVAGGANETHVAVAQGSAPVVHDPRGPVCSEGGEDAALEHAEARFGQVRELSGFEHATLQLRPCFLIFYFDHTTNNEAPLLHADVRGPDYFHSAGQFAGWGSSSSGGNDSTMSSVRRLTVMTLRTKSTM